MKAGRSLCSRRWQCGRSPLASGVRAGVAKGSNKGLRIAFLGGKGRGARTRKLPRQPDKSLSAPARRPQTGKQIP
jgi:hypothetical protein